MRTPATSSRHKILSLLAVVALVLGLVPALGSQAAAADEADGGALAEGGEPLSGLLASGSEGGAQSQVGGVGVGSAEGTGETFPEGAAEGSSDGSSQEVPLIAAAQLSREVALQPLSEGDGVPLVADVLAGKPTRFVNQVVALDGDASVLGSFTVDGMTYAVTGEGTVELVAVGPAALADDLVAGLAGAAPVSLAGAPSGKGSGSGVPPRIVAEQGPFGAASTQPPLEGEPSDDSEDGDASEPVTFEVPESVEHDGATYFVTSIGPRTFVSCGADVVRIPASVASVDEAAFRGSSADAIEVAEGNPDLSSYEGVLYDADQTSLLLVPEGKQGAARIPKTAEVVPADAFSHCASVTAIEADAGSAAFSSRNGCLYDASGTLVAMPPTLEVARVVAPMLGSFAADGMTYAVTGGGTAELAAVEPAALTDALVAALAVSSAADYPYTGCMLVPPPGGDVRWFWNHTYPPDENPDSVKYQIITPVDQIQETSGHYYYTLGDDGVWTSSKKTNTYLTYYCAYSSDGKLVRKWYTDAALTNEVQPGTTTSDLANQLVYPDTEEVVVTFDQFNGLGVANKISIPRNTSIDTITTPTLNGWTFAGYTDNFGTEPSLFVNADGTGTARRIGRSMTLYANWTKEVSLDANRGEAGSLASITAGIGRPLGQKCTQVDAVDVDYPIRKLFEAGVTDYADWAPARAGYEFAGYYDTASADGGTCWIDKDGAGSTVTSAIPSTLYARWAANAYLVSYDVAGGELPAGAQGSYTADDAFDLPSPTRYGYQFEGWDVEGAQGAGVETVTGADGSKVTRVKQGTYGDLSCTARWTLRYDLDVPVADPGSVTFEADSFTGQVRVKPGTSAEGELRSYMAVPVALDELSCEGLGAAGSVDVAGGASELEAIFGAGSAAKVRFTATLGEGGAAYTARVTAGGPSATASLAGLSISAATSPDAPGRISVSYGLELDSDLPIPPVRDAAPVARLSYTVSLDRPGV